MPKRMPVGTVLLGVFWLVSAAYWALTIIIWVLSKFGITKSLYTYGLFFLEGYLFSVAVVELVILVSLLVIYFTIKDESLKKSWKKISAITTGFACMPVIVLIISALLLYSF